MLFTGDTEFKVASFREDTNAYTAAGNTGEDKGWLFRVDMSSKCFDLLPGIYGLELIRIELN